MAVLVIWAVIRTDITRVGYAISVSVCVVVGEDGTFGGSCGGGVCVGGLFDLTGPDEDED